MSDRPDPSEDPFACILCGGYIGERRRIQGRETCRACAGESAAGPTRSTYDPAASEDISDDLSGRYVTQGVESGVFDADGDLLGHVGLLDLDGVTEGEARRGAREVPGATALLRSSEDDYHVWSLAVRPLSEWIETADSLGVDAAHVELSESRGCSVLRLDAKVSTETGETVVSAPDLLGTEGTDGYGPLSAPHARLLADEFGATVDTARGEWVGQSVETRVFLAHIDGLSGDE